MSEFLGDSLGYLRCVFVNFNCSKNIEWTYLVDISIELYINKYLI